MTETDERFDRLLDAMVNKPPLEVEKTPRDEHGAEDLREEDEG